MSEYKVNKSKIVLRTSFILILVFLTSLFLVNAACSDKVACKNQNGNYFCISSDTSCTYVKFTGTEPNCVEDAGFTDPDTDSDSWTDSCDALPNNITEWIDLDGDGIGSNSDCDDFNATPCPRNETPEPENKLVTGPSGGGGGVVIKPPRCKESWDCGQWSACSGGKQTRSCQDTNSCGSQDNKPSQEQSCTDEEKKDETETNTVSGGSNTNSGTSSGGTSGSGNLQPVLRNVTNNNNVNQQKEDKIERNFDNSPLSDIVPEEFVPVAATGLSVVLLILGNILWELFSKIFLKTAAGMLVHHRKARKVTDKYLGTEIFGIKIKVREWISTFFAAVLFAFAIAYSNFFSNLDFREILLISILVNIIIYSLRNVIRLYMDKKDKISTEYEMWWLGVLVTLVSAWLGNPFCLPGYVASGNNRKEFGGRIKYIINMVTFAFAILFFVINEINPNRLALSAMLLALSTSFIQFLPYKPFHGFNIYHWNKKLWAISFLPITVTYIFLVLII